MRLTLDTSTMVSAFRSRTGASRRIVEMIPDLRFRLVVSAPLLFEYETVLLRPEHASVHGYSRDQIDELMVAIAFYADKTRIHYGYRPQLRDANDEMVLEAAINGKANIIVTHNVRDFLPAAHSFGIEVLTPERMMRERLRI